jgi:hypothetical protein
MILSAHRKIQAMHMVASGLTATKVAEIFGCHPYDFKFAVRQVRRYRQLYKGPHRRDNSAILQARRAGRSLKDIGCEIGVTRERIRQILLRHTIETGESFPHVPRTPRTPRPPKQCPACGAKIGRKSSYCRKHIRQPLRSRLSEQTIKDAESRRINGASWQEVCDPLSVVYQHMAKLIWTRMRRDGRLSTETANAVFGPKGWGWLDQWRPKADSLKI